jgi:hypothetical protein
MNFMEPVGRLARLWPTANAPQAVALAFASGSRARGGDRREGVASRLRKPVVRKNPSCSRQGDFPVLRHRPLRLCAFAQFSAGSVHFDQCSTLDFSYLLAYPARQPWRKLWKALSS